VAYTKRHYKTISYCFFPQVDFKKNAILSQRIERSLTKNRAIKRSEKLNLVPLTHTPFNTGAIKLLSDDVESERNNPCFSKF
jgi:hypothetical protein